MDQKIDHMASCWQVGGNSKKAKKLKVFQSFLVPRPSNFEAKLSKKRPQTDQKSNKIWVSILVEFLKDLEPTWVEFGIVLAAKLEPSWHQLGTKPDLPTNQKNDHFLESLRIDF